MKVIVVRIGCFADGKGTGSYQLFGEVVGDVYEPLTAERLRAVGFDNLGLVANDPVPLETALRRMRRLRDAMSDHE